MVSFGWGITPAMQSLEIQSTDGTRSDSLIESIAIAWWNHVETLTFVASLKYIYRVPKKQRTSMDSGGRLLESPDPLALLLLPFGYIWMFPAYPYIIQVMDDED